ncbi:hypothetical protein [Sphingobium boeckii]|uniref:Uncharacterized protein n=1 Tax=Sphingobium boeckii TaxID=1082345 RepID=A0A7W9ECW2_9SPHN|nr:hypothetical protein [Sphingobium boeckii]MBB5684319.1 hypothetical protein [Sphingobium boeckii]
MTSEVILKSAGSGSAEHLEMIELVEVIRQATMHVIRDVDDPAMKSSILMAAAATFAGTIMGHMIVAGLLHDQDKKRVTDAMARNFRTGIDVGKRRAMRVACDEFGGNA